MTRNITRVALAVVLASAATVALGSCTAETRCDYIDREVADPLHPTLDDVTYCWQGLDSLGLYVFRFEADGDPDGGVPNSLFIIDPPNSLEPAGQELRAAWNLTENVSTPLGPVSVLDIPGLGGEAQVTVNSTSLVLGLPGSTAQTPMRRAICKGYGFEQVNKKCRGSAERP